MRLAVDRLRLIQSEGNRNMRRGPFCQERQYTPLVLIKQLRFIYEEVVIPFCSPSELPYWSAQATEKRDRNIVWIEDTIVLKYDIMVSTKYIKHETSFDCV